jgi:hypothetical protein
MWIDILSLWGIALNSMDMATVVQYDQDCIALRMNVFGREATKASINVP